MSVTTHSGAKRREVKSLRWAGLDGCEGGRKLAFWHGAFVLFFSFLVLLLFSVGVFCYVWSVFVKGGRKSVASWVGLLSARF